MKLENYNPIDKAIAMASTGLDSDSISIGQFRSTLSDKPPLGDPLRQRSSSLNPSIRDEEAMPFPHQVGNSLKPVHDQTNRRLKPRHIQLIGIGGYLHYCLMLQPCAQYRWMLIVWADTGLSEPLCLCRLVCHILRDGCLVANDVLRSRVDERKIKAPRWMLVC